MHLHSSREKRETEWSEASLKEGDKTEKGI